MIPMRELYGSLTHYELERFAAKQWNLSADALGRWFAGVCLRGRYTYRVIIPITMGQTLVAFQARALGSAEPRYLTSHFGMHDDKNAECGRPAEAILFNYDALQPGDHALLVEGVGDAMNWHERPTVNVASLDVVAARFADPESLTAPMIRPVRSVALLGTTLTDEKAALLCAKSPATVTLALDPGVPQETRLRLQGDLRAWGFIVREGIWLDAKDAGAGASLHVAQPTMRRVGQ
jgi:hypothetical protein